MIITKRQDVIFSDDGRRLYVCDSSCRTAEIIKWSVFLVLTILIFLYLFLGYWHARRRIRKGLQPMFYHRWLAPRSWRKQQNNPAYYNPPPGSYGMQQYPEPPPMYNSAGMPPAYAGPDGGSKVAPQQTGIVPSQQGPPAQGAPQVPPPAL